MEKTNVMRILDGKKLAYQAYEYACDGALSAEEVAQVLGKEPQRVFKTLVTRGKSGALYVFMIPAGRALHLKRAAAAVGEKSIEMLKAKELLPLTGYVHGGCSPIGMKKQYRTVADETAGEYESILFSAGKIGYQVELPFAALQQVVRVTLADVSMEPEAKV